MGKGGVGRVGGLMLGWIPKISFIPCLLKYKHLCLVDVVHECYITSLVLASLEQYQKLATRNKPTPRPGKFHFVPGRQLLCLGLFRVDYFWC